MVSYEYVQFINEKILAYLPHDRVSCGDKISFRCPLCGDSKKSARKKRGFYYLKTASYYCFNCGESMPGIKLLQFLSGIDYDEIKKEYIRLFLKSGLRTDLSAHCEPIPSDEPSFTEMKSIIKKEWKKPLTDSAMAYLEGRKVMSAPFRRDDLYSCSGRNNEDYILIPWRVNNVDAFYQLNDYQKHGSIKYIFPKNRKKPVFGLDNIDITWPYLIVFEGVYDSLFVKNALATGTKSISEYQLRLIGERYPSHKICVSFDNDVSGFKSMSKMIDSGSNFKFFRWFDSQTKSKDINERILETGDVNEFSDKQRLEQMIYSPLQMKMWLVQNGKWFAQPKFGK